MSAAMQANRGKTAPAHQLRQQPLRDLRQIFRQGRDVLRADPWRGAPIGEPEQDRLAVIEEYADGLQTIIKKDRDGLH